MLVSDGADCPPRHSSRVLILVLVDVGLGQEEVQTIAVELMKVLILVLVDVGLGQTHYVQRTSEGPVLILVLVDVGLGPPVSSSAKTKPVGLNPCFSGCWSRTQER